MKRTAEETEHTERLIREYHMAESALGATAAMVRRAVRRACKYELADAQKAAAVIRALFAAAESRLALHLIEHGPHEQEHLRWGGLTRYTGRQQGLDARVHWEPIRRRRKAVAA